MKPLRVLLVVVCLCCISLMAKSQFKGTTTRQLFTRTQNNYSKPWVFWYWLHGMVSKQGITADLEALQKAGIGGFYLMPIKDTLQQSLHSPAARQLTPEWFALVRHAMQEAKRLGLEAGIHVSDGFALAGGPWIKPEQSMQKVVWSRKMVAGGTTYRDSLPTPPMEENYYEDIAVYAYPVQPRNLVTTENVVPTVTTSNGSIASFLPKTGGKESFKADSTCWIKYSFEQPFTCRSIVIKVSGNNYQAHRLWVQTSNDGVRFTNHTRLQPPRHGWQDGDADVTHSIPQVTARHYRFVYDKQGTEPGAEDLDAAKWKPVLKVKNIILSAEAKINQYESKNGEVWRVSERTSTQQVPDSLCVPLHQCINISRYYRNGRLEWKVPEGSWVILRMGHTSTGHTNATAGGGKGLECDKMDTAAVRLQFNNWFGRIYNEVGDTLVRAVLKVFHVDSWECGSQNWSAGFAKAFAQRRGYDLMPYLPVMAGIPVGSAKQAEKVLYDIRQTIVELVNDVFYKELKKLSEQKQCGFSAESIAPTMMSDGLMHYQWVDRPMGEFWLRSPTHDKPNDMLDAISGGHIYGKPIIQAESFTELRTMWDEHPGMLKAATDRVFASGINKLVLHVSMQNPWLNKKPGITLDGIGLYYQRDQTWFQQSKAWIEYLQRCQGALRAGWPVTDIAVFTGEELPRRSLLPDRLVHTLPGLFGAEKVAAEKIRLANVGQPLRQLPVGVTHSANMADPEDWVNALNGYAYDCINPDALWNRLSVKQGQLQLKQGNAYKLLVLVADHKMNPGNIISAKTVQTIARYIKQGATVVMDSVYIRSFKAAGYVFSFTQTDNGLTTAKLGAGLVVLAPFTQASLAALQLQRDVAIETPAIPFSQIAYTHRKQANTDLYFVANQKDTAIQVQLSFRVTGKLPELWNPLNGDAVIADSWFIKEGRTYVNLSLAEYGSTFVVFERPTKLTKSGSKEPLLIYTHPVTKAWKVQFDTVYGGPAQPVVFDSLKSWSLHSNDSIKYYSGTAVYSNAVTINETSNVELLIDTLYNLATVEVNGVDCGTIWTKPYRVNITKAVKKGKNDIRIKVTNTWANRIIGDHALPESKRLTYTNAPYRLEGKPLLPAGIVGKVTIEER